MTLSLRPPPLFIRHKIIWEVPLKLRIVLDFLVIKSPNDVVVPFFDTTECRPTTVISTFGD